MTQKYRTDDGTKWGAGIGRNLTASEVDVNFWDVDQRLVSLEGLPSAEAGIDHFTVSGQQFSVVLTDSTIVGPYTLPVAHFIARGEWQPLTAYSVLDTFTINGGLYEVIFAHTSNASFDPFANDGSGHDYYSLLIETPGSSLPSGGATGQILQKSSSTDYAVMWGYKTPTGGTARQYMIKTNSTQDNAAWGNPEASDIHFTPVTASALTSSFVGDALEELQSNIEALETTVGAFSISVEDLTDVETATGDPATGALLFYAGIAWEMSAEPASGDMLRWDGSAWTPFAKAESLEFVIDGGVATILTGLKGYVEVPWDCTITRATLLGDQSGSIVVDVWRCTYAQFDAGVTYPTAFDTLTSSTPPTISSAVKSQDATLTSWTTTLSAGDILAFNVNSVTDMARVTISLKVALS